MPTPQRPYEFDSPRAYLEYLLSLVEGADEVALSIGWHSTFYAVRKRSRIGTQAYHNQHHTLRRDEEGNLIVRYHATDVVTVAEDGSITLDNGGWATRSTHRVMNAVLAARSNVGVCRENYATTVYMVRWDRSHRRTDLPLTIPAVA